MSQKQFDFDKAVSALRSVSPATTPTLGRLSSNRQQRFPYRATAIGLAATASVIVFWPRAGSGLAWAQVVSETKQVQRYYITTKSLKVPAPVFEVWVDGYRYACVISDPEHKQLTLESRCDGTTLVNYHNFGRSKNGEPAVAYKSKVLKKEYPGNLGMMGMESNIIDDLLSNKKYEVLKQSEVEKDGVKLITYSVIQTERYKDQGGWRDLKSRMNIYADPRTKRVVRSERVDDKGQTMSVTTIQYPESMPDTVFQFRRKGVTLRDLDAEKRDLAATMKKGLGSKTVKGTSITLRTVLYDRSGGLWVLWTGNPPSGDLKHLVKVVGYPTPKVTKHSFPVNTNVINAFGLKGFTVAAGKEEFLSKPAPSIGLKLYGMGIGLQDQKFKTVDLIIPVVDPTGKIKLGDANFRNVPVRRIQRIYDYSEELGLR